MDPNPSNMPAQYPPPPQQPAQRQSGKEGVSLYVCDIPQNITKDELDSLFKCFSGFNEVRLARDKNRQRIAFVDYADGQCAEYAMNSARGFRF